MGSNCLYFYSDHTIIVICPPGSKGLRLKSVLPNLPMQAIEHASGYVFPSEAQMVLFVIRQEHAGSMVPFLRQGHLRLH